jgi:hypothetical protein
MFKITSCAAAAVMAAFISASPAQAAMAPITHYGAPGVQHVDCDVGFRLGPLGTCVIGTEERHDRVIEEHRAADEGCETKSVNRTDAAGNSETRTKTNCN